MDIKNHRAPGPIPVKKGNSSIWLKMKTLIDICINKIKTNWQFTVIFLLTCGFFFIYLLPINLKYPQLPTDTHRDVAYAQNVLNGNSLFDDPAIKGAKIWYPPLSPLIMATLAKITGLDLFTLYNSSTYILNLAIPLLFFCFIKKIFDKNMAFFCTLFLPIMPWIHTHFFNVPMPSIQVLAVILCGLILFIYILKKRQTIPFHILLGIVTGLSLMFHSISGLVLYGSVLLTLFMHTLMNIKNPEQKNIRNWIFLSIQIIVPLIIWSPYLVINLFSIKQNTVPFDFISPHIVNKDWFLYVPNRDLYIITILFLITGILVTIKKIKQPAVLCLYILLFLTIGGQTLGYLKYYTRIPGSRIRFLAWIPAVLPHEFQWMFQLFAIVFIVCGLLFIIRKLLPGKKILFAYLLIAIFLIPGYRNLFISNSQKQKQTYVRKYEIQDWAQWINLNTDKNDVFVVSDKWINYIYLQPFTARKILFHNAAHMNYKENVEARKNAKEMFLNTADRKQITDICQKYEITWFLLKKNDISNERFQFFSSQYPVYFHKIDIYIFKMVQT